MYDFNGIACILSARSTNVHEAHERGLLRGSSSFHRAFTELFAAAINEPYACAVCGTTEYFKRIYSGT